MFDWLGWFGRNVMNENRGREGRREEREELKRLDRIEAQLVCNREEIRQLSRLVGVLVEQGKKIMAQLDNVNAKLVKLTDAGDGMALLLKTLHDDLVAAGTDQVKLDALAASMDTKADSWIADTLANTIADPNNPPPA